MMRYLAVTIILAVFNICFAFNPSSGFLDKPIQRNTEVEFNYVSTYNGLNMTSLEQEISFDDSNSVYFSNTTTNCFEFYFKLDSINKFNPLIESIYHNNNFTQGFNIGINDSNIVSFTIYTGSELWRILSNKKLNNSKWYYILITHSIGDTVKIYIDGELDNKKYLQNDLYYSNKNTNLFVGKSKKFNETFSGILYGLRIGYRIPDDNEIAARYSNCTFFEETNINDIILGTRNLIRSNCLSRSDTNAIEDFFLSKGPVIFMWDINADGIFDTTTIEPTLIYDYGAYDTTYVIVKAITDSKTFEFDTIEIKLYENIINIHFDSLKTVEVGIADYHVCDISDNAETILLKKDTPRKVDHTGIILNKNGQFHVDSIFNCYVTHDGSKCVFTVTKTYGYDFFEEIVIIVDSLGNKTKLPFSCDGVKYITENDSFFLAYFGEMSNCFIYGSEYSSNTVCLLNLYTNEVKYIKRSNLSKEYDENMCFDDNLNYIAKVMRTKPILTVFNHDAETLFVRDDIYSQRDPIKYPNSLITIDQNNIIYTMTGLFSHFYYENQVEDGFEILINSYSTTGNLLTSDTLKSVNVDEIELTKDTKYIIGYSDSYNSKRNIICIWDYSTKEKLFQREFYTSDHTEVFRVKYLYNSQNDTFLIFINLGNQHYIIDKYGRDIRNEELFDFQLFENGKFAYKKDGTNLKIFKVRWD